MKSVFLLIFGYRQEIRIRILWTHLRNLPNGLLNVLSIIRLDGIDKEHVSIIEQKGYTISNYLDARCRRLVMVPNLLTKDSSKSYSYNLPTRSGVRCI